MLTLVTGLPGHAKTLYTLATVPEEYQDRDIYYYGIEDLKLPWIKLEDPKKWHELPDGSVIVIDEAQQIFPLRQPKIQVPIHCSKFETHRHQGHDIILITQDAKLIDHHVRRLCGRHHHVVRARTGHKASIVYTAGKVFDPNDYHQKKTCEKKPFAYPKNVFELYKSAEVHTVKTKYPLRLIFFPIMIIAFFVAFYFGVGVFKKIGGSGEQEVSQQTKGSSNEIPQQLKKASYESGTLEEYLYIHTPRIENLPHSSPFYDSTYQANTYPKPNCIGNDKKCICYSQQGTRNVRKDCC